MPPPINQRRRNRPRPISPRDNPSTTGQLINPNGSYVANTTPQLAAYAGGQGGFGATLPQVNLGAGSTNWNTGFAALQYRFGEKAPFRPSKSPYTPHTSYGNARTGPYVGQGTNLPYRDPSSAPALPANQAMQQYRAGEKAIAPEYGLMAQGGRPATINPASLAAMGLPANAPAQQGYKLVNGQWVDPTNPAAAQQGAGGALGEGDFYGYERDPETGRSVRVVKNAATSSFTNELRWDPQRGKYVRIGQLMQEGKLDQKGGWHARGNKKPQGAHRRAQIAARQQQMQAQPQAPASYAVSNDFISFNTAVSFNTATG